MDQLDDVRYGWEFMEKVLGADFASLQAQNDLQTTSYKIIKLN